MFSEPSRALTTINPKADQLYVDLGNQAISLSQYAQQRVIKSSDDLKACTNDLNIIRQLQKQAKDKLTSYIKPFVDYVNEVKAAFKLITDPLDEAEKLNREKSTAYLMEMRRRQEEAEAINRQKEELARREAAFSGTGEVTINTEPVVAPAAIKKVRSDMGSMGLQDNWRWELVDIKLLPAEYLMPNASILTPVVKASKGKITIPGIRIWNAGGIRISQR